MWRENVERLFECAFSRFNLIAFSNVRLETQYREASKVIVWKAGVNPHDPKRLPVVPSRKKHDALGDVVERGRVIMTKDNVC